MLKKLIGGKVYRIFLLIELLMFSIPMSFYDLLRLKGTLDPKLWSSNHGPWKNEFLGQLVILFGGALLAMVPAILITSICMTIVEKKFYNILRGLLLAICFSLLWFIYLVNLYWTID